MRRLGIFLLLLAACLAGCDYTGDATTVSTTVSVTTSGTTSSTGSVAVSGTLYLDDTFDASCTGCTLHNAAYIAGSGVIILAASDAYILYALPLADALTVQVTFSGAGDTDGSKRVLLHLTDSIDAWVGDNHVWTDSSLIEVRHVDGRLRFRVGGSGDAEFATDYVYDGLDSGEHVLTVSNTASAATLSLDSATVASFSASTFQPSGALYLLVGGGVLNESSLNVVIRRVAVYY